MQRVLITGASGFIGRHACTAFRAAGWHVTAVTRSDSPVRLDADEVRALGDLARPPLAPHMAGVDCVVHLAARAHRMHETGPRALAAYRAANVDITERLAIAARSAGVRRFIFVSTAKVLGEERERPYGEADVPAPSDPYALTKYESEQVVLEVAGSAMEPVILRPPMVYGPGGKGNVPRLIRLARLSMRVPLPFGAVNNRRSLLFSGNLADALVHCAVNARAAGRAFLVSDGEDVSTPELIRRIATYLGGIAKLFDVSPRLLFATARLARRANDARRLLGTLALDTRDIRSRLDWTPPFTLDAGLRATVLSAMHTF